MFEIIEKQNLSSEINLFRVKAPEIAASHKPGQFVVLRLYEEGERIPITVADVDISRGLITLIVQAIGKTTISLGQMNEGEKILDIAGPLGMPTHIESFGTVACVGGGVGTAEMYPLVKALKASQNRVISVIGARKKDLIIMEEEFRGLSDELFISTDDGSYGQKGFVTDILNDFIGKGTKIDLLLCAGPIPMMKAVSDLTRTKGIKTLVSLNPIMVDGTGLCGSCRLTLDGKVKFVCVDGPEFDGHKVDFDELIQRNSMYLCQEKEAKDCCRNKK